MEAIEVAYLSVHALAVTKARGDWAPLEAGVIAVYHLMHGLGPVEYLS
jgi:hypothetical protein